MAGTQSAVCREVCLKSTPLSIFLMDPQGASNWTLLHALSKKRDSNFTCISTKNSLSELHLLEKSFFPIHLQHSAFFLRLRIEHSLVLDIHFIRSISWMCWLTYQVYTNCNNTVDIANMIHTLKSFSDVRGI